MKKNYVLIIVGILLFLTSCNKSEKEDCLINFEPILIDERDGQSYDLVEIGDQVWMAENLNYGASGRCYEYNDSLCNIYGRLYTLAEILDKDKIIDNTSLIKGICPNGFHIPTIYEWRNLIDYVGGKELAAFKLLDPSSWKHEDPSEFTNEFGFSILPSGTKGGYHFENENGEWEYVEFLGLGNLTKLISSTTAGHTSSLWHLRVSNGPRLRDAPSTNLNIQEDYFCVRCIKDCE